MEELEVSTLMGFLGLGIGLLFGALTHRSNFCTMGAIADAISFGDFRRARTWMLAVAVAILGVQAMHQVGMIDLAESIYLGATVNWLATIVGGLIFGFGMVVASGCPARNLVRVGGGDLKALVVLIFIAIFGYMALRGLFAPIRLSIEGAGSLDLAAAGMEDQQLGALLSGIFGMSEPAARLGSAALAVIVLLAVCFRDASFRGSPLHLSAGVGIGLLVVAGWWATGVAGADDFEPTPLASLTFIAPASNALQYLMTFTGSTINFGIASVGGVILGAFLSALLAGRINVVSFYDTKDTVHHMLGGAMMGVGGVMALGCTIGQGLTGISTLGLGSILAVAAIVLGGVIGVKYQERSIGL